MRVCTPEGVRGVEGAVAEGVFFTVTVFVLIFGLFAFRNMAGSCASGEFDYKGRRGGNGSGRLQGVYK